MLRADDVLAARFRQTQLGEGYDEREVDGLLDAVVTSLRRYEAGEPATDVLTAAGVRAARFTPTRLRRGYGTAEVDALLEHVAETLAGYERGAQPAPVPAPVGRPTGFEDPGTGGPRAGLAARLLGVLRGDPRR